MTTWTQRGLAVLCSSGLPVLCSTDTHHRRTGRAYYVGTIPCRVTISYPRWYAQTEALYAHDLASLDDWESVSDFVFLGDLGVRGGGVVSDFVFLEPLPLRVKLGNLLVAQVLAEVLRPPPLLFTCCSSGLPVLCSSVHIPNASPRRARLHARGAECGVHPA